MATCSLALTQRTDKALGQRGLVAMHGLVQAVGMVLYGIELLAAIGRALSACVGPREGRLDAVGRVVGKGQRYRARGGNGQQMAVAQSMFSDVRTQFLGKAFGKAAFQILLGVEQREAAFSRARLHRGGIGCITHIAGDGLGLLQACIAGVMQAQQNQGVAQPCEAHADAALCCASRCCSGRGQTVASSTLSSMRT